MSTVVYASSSSTQEIVTLRFDASDGSLHELSRLVVANDGNQAAGCLPLAPSPDGRFLYAALRSEPFPFSTFAIDPQSGVLTHVHTAHGADSVVLLRAERTGRWLFSASWSGAKVLVNPIDAAGIVGDTTQVLDMPPATHFTLPDLSGRFVYIAAMGGDVVLCHGFDPATGRLTDRALSETRTKPGAGPRHLAISADGMFLYVVNEHHGTVGVYARDGQTGALTQVQTVSILPEDMAGGIAVEPANPVARHPPGASDVHLSLDGRFLYASDRATTTLAALRVDARSGRLTSVMSIDSEVLPRGFIVDPSGKFLLCAGLLAGTIGSYAMDGETGALRRVGVFKVADRLDWLEAMVLRPQ
jgi:6-phosphogluconolactonase